MRKTDEVRLALREGDEKKALQIGKDFQFGMTPADHKQIVRGWECLWNPTFYEQLGFDTEVETEKAIEILSMVVNEPAGIHG